MVMLFVILLALVPLSTSYEYRTYIKIGTGTASKWGHVLAYYSYYGFSGLVCDNDFSFKSADYLCKHAGYSGAESWGSVAKNGTSALPSSYMLDYLSKYNWMYSRVNCTGTSGYFNQDCTTTKKPTNCNRDEAVILYCGQSPNLTSTVVHGEGVLLDGSNNRSNGTGSAIVSNVNGTQTLICPDSLITDSRSKFLADAICRENGYVYSWKTTTHFEAHSDDDRANGDWLWMENIGAVMLHGFCKAGAKNLLECSTAIGVPCNIDKTLVVSCSHRRYQIKEFLVLANPDGKLGLVSRSKWSEFNTSYGTVIAVVEDTLTRRVAYSLVRADQSAGDITATAICAQVGYKSGVYHQYKTVNYQNKLSYGFIHKQGITRVLDGLQCASGNMDPRTCDLLYKEEGKRFYPGHSMVVECS